ncbi:methyltransferase domain-containing protein [Nonomuraea typhae]|uniref:methyltransferase domain-containing protein n=1 Tax=Nonomuraea typhae TaxID=2603600 RepID=UPI0012FB0DC4|nr:methyltransferase domain-containing protein [Nonomuraea typhae]
MARSVRGIEHLVAAEIRQARLGRVVEVRHREVWFEPRRPGLLGLRLADDVLLVGAVVDGIGPGRSSLRRLASAASAIDTARLTTLAAHLGPPPGAAPCATPDPGRGVDVSASFLGRRGYTRFDVEDAVGPGLGRPYHSRRDGRKPPAGTTSWRVTVEGERAVIALRAGARPLHRRPYKVRSVPGTLHPPLAAAMVHLAEPKGLVVDPCCGAGTTLIEAAAHTPGVRALGFDHASQAVAAAAANGPDLAWSVADAGRIPLPAGSVDRVLVNPPWQRQVRLAGEGHRLWRELRRVLAGDGRVVALVPEVPRGWAVQERLEISLFGRHPVLVMMSPDKS